MAPLALLQHVGKFDFYALLRLIGCRRESRQRKADYSAKYAQALTSGWPTIHQVACPEP